MWTHPRCPSVGGWINKLWYIRTMDYYSVMKRNELSSHEKIRRNLKCILLSERRPSEKALSSTIPTSHTTHKYVLVNKKPHICHWSHRIIMELRNPCHPATSQPP